MKEFVLIRITKFAKKKLDSFKIHPKQPYSEVIDKLLKEFEEKKL
jgi:hypothetical protein